MRWPIRLKAHDDMSMIYVPSAIIMYSTEMQLIIAVQVELNIECRLIAESDKSASMLACDNYWVDPSMYQVLLSWWVAFVHGSYIDKTML